LKIVLSERFADVPRPELMRDLLVPLKNALGNACKHGNRRDPTKAVSLEIVLTGKGALIAVSDEGSGFDAGLTLRRFQRQENYFVNHGCGFRNLHRALSTVSYENGGRTLLLCFRPTMRGPDNAPSASAAFSKVLDAGWLQAVLSAQLPEFSNGRAKLESCRVYPTRGRAGDDCGTRCVLRVSGPDGPVPATRILTARLHATEAAAADDFEFATRLYDSGVTRRLAVPLPVIRPAEELRLVLYDFDPWINLWEYLTHRRTLKSLHHAAERAGEALAGLHRSVIDFRGNETDLTEEGFEAMVARTTAALQSLPGGSDLVGCFLDCVKRMENAPSRRQPRVLAPIHGAFGWDRIHYGVDGRFYLYDFEKCQRSDPGLDLGGFAADLLCFTLSKRDEGAYRSGLDALLNQYNSEAERSLSANDLRFYVSVALVERLQRTELRTTARFDQWLAALDAVLLGWGEVATSEELA
jgi:anti-sigma regulatory factor (Ser/Thr protein kinase)